MPGMLMHTYIYTYIHPYIHTSMNATHILSFLKLFCWISVRWVFFSRSDRQFVFLLSSFLMMLSIISLSRSSEVIFWNLVILYCIFSFHAFDRCLKIFLFQQWSVLRSIYWYLSCLHRVIGICIHWLLCLLMENKTKIWLYYACSNNIHILHFVNCPFISLCNWNSSFSSHQFD